MTLTRRRHGWPLASTTTRPGRIGTALASAFLILISIAHAALAAGFPPIATPDHGAPGSVIQVESGAATCGPKGFAVLLGAVPEDSNGTVVPTTWTAVSVGSMVIQDSSGYRYPGVARFRFTVPEVPHGRYVVMVGCPPRKQWQAYSGAPFRVDALPSTDTRPASGIPALTVTGLALLWIAASLAAGNLSRPPSR